MAQPNGAIFPEDAGEVYRLITNEKGGGVLCQRPLESAAYEIQSWFLTVRTNPPPSWPRGFPYPYGSFDHSRNLIPSARSTDTGTAGTPETCTFVSVQLQNRKSLPVGS